MFINNTFHYLLHHCIHHKSRLVLYCLKYHLAAVVITIYHFTCTLLKLFLFMYDGALHCIMLTGQVGKLSTIEIIEQYLGIVFI